MTATNVLAFPVDGEPQAPGQGAAGATRRRLRLDPMAATASALMANTVVTAALGMAFWAIGSRTYSARQLGESAALISAMMLLSVVSQLNLSMGISRFLPQVTERRWRPVVASYGVTAVVALVVTGAFAVIAPEVSKGFAFLGDDPTLVIALVVSVVLWNVFALQDAVLTVSRWAFALPIENGLFGVLKIGLMVWLASAFADQGIFVAWLVAMAVMLVPVNALIFSRVLPNRRPADERQKATVLPITDRGRITRYLAIDYAASLLNQGYTALLPLLVVAVLGGDANAYFYVAFVIAGAVRAVAQAMSLSLVVEGAHDETELTSFTRLSVIRYIKYAIPGTAVLVAGAGLLLMPFGGAYVDQGTTLLRLLLIATVPQAMVSLYIGVERVRTRVSRVLAVESAIVVLVTLGAIAGMNRYGLIGVGIAWLLVQSAVALAIAPALWRACRRPAPSLRLVVPQ